MDWSGSNASGFHFTANPGNFSTSVSEAGPFAQLGRERNGIFFPSGRSDQDGSPGIPLEGEDLTP